MKILFLSLWFPYPADNGSKLRIFNLIKHLSAHHEIYLVSFTAESITGEQLATMSQYCRLVETARYLPFHPGRIKAAAGYLSSRPRSVIDTYSLEMQKLVQRIGKEHIFDLVIASQIDMAPYALLLPAAPKILEEVELTVLYEQYRRQRDAVQKFRQGLTWWKLSRYTGSLLRVFDGCTTVSENEKQRILQIVPGYQPISVIPNGVDIGHNTGDFGSPEADTLIYSGALTYTANFDAVDYFLRQVFPLIQRERPQVKLTVTGKLNGVPLSRLLHNENVKFTGFLNDIRPAIAHSWINIVPLRVGGGTRLKILESLALGTPVVTTSKGAEGLDLVAGRDLLVADEPADFAAAVLRLLRDPELRIQISNQGRQTIANLYDWPLIGRQFADFVQMVATKGLRSAAR